MRFKARKTCLCFISLLQVVVLAFYLTCQYMEKQKFPQGHGLLPMSVHNNITMKSRYINVTELRRKNREATRTTSKAIPVATTKQKSIPVTKKLPLKSGSIRSDCQNIHYPENLSLQEGWYPTDNSHASYVFSAYFDERVNQSISIIGAKSGGGSYFICQSWKKRTDGQLVTMVESVATVSFLPEGHGRKYSSAIFKCPIDKNNVPHTVSIVTNACATPLNLLKVRHTRPEKRRRQFTVCVTPFNFRYGRAYELVEWIEINRMLGADFFTFYNFSTAENVDRVIDYYSSLGLVEVVHWNLPMGVDTWPRTGQPVEIHYFGQLAFLNECWRRNRKKSEFVANIDMDEFIIPRGENMRTWRDLMGTLNKAPAYVFRNVFFRKEWDDPKLEFSGKDDASKYKLNTLLKTVRETQIQRHYIRSKYMVRTDSVVVLGIHNIPRLRDDVRPSKVTGNKALLHHYRDWENPNDETARQTDMTMVDKYKDDIIKRVRTVWSKLPGVKLV